MTSNDPSRARRTGASERDTFPVVVHVLLWRAGGVFLLRRSATGFLDGYFVLPGGHQHSNESVRDAAAREVREETGATVAPDDLRPVAVMAYRHGDARGLNVVFETTEFSGEPTVGEPGLFDVCLWADPDQLPSPHPSWLNDALDMSRTGVWFRDSG